MKSRVLKIVLLLNFILINFAYGQEDWSLQVGWPDSPVGTSLNTSSGIAGLVKYFFEWSITIGIILTFGSLIYASFKYIVSTGDPQKLSKAKNMLSSSFLGLLLLFSSWLLISILNPELGVISNIGIPNLETDLETKKQKIYQEKNLCDYGVVSYNLKSTGNPEKALVQHGESKIIQDENLNTISIFPYSSITCKKQKSFGDDIIKEGDNKNSIRFIEARTLSIKKEPVCNKPCAKTPKTSCKKEIFIELKKNQIDMPKFCYDQRYNLEGYTVKNYSVLYISQKPASKQTTCLAGDKEIKGGGGCSLNLYNSIIASGCGDLITSTNSNGQVAGSYDKAVNCIEIARFKMPVSEDFPNIDFAH